MMGCGTETKMTKWPCEHVLFFEDGTHSNWTATDTNELVQVFKDKKVIEAHTYMPWQECVVKYGIEK